MKILILDMEGTHSGRKAFLKVLASAGLLPQYVSLAQVERLTKENCNYPKITNYLIEPPTVINDDYDTPINYNFNHPPKQKKERKNIPDKRKINRLKRKRK